jgi:hypothetical protein
VQYPWLQSDLDAKQPTIGLRPEFLVKKTKAHGNTVDGCFAPGLAGLPKVRAEPSIGCRTQFD